MKNIEFPSGCWHLIDKNVGGFWISSFYLKLKEQNTVTGW